MTGPARGRFITLEGGEGVGKSTQARLLSQALCDRGLPVLRTREPGGAPGAEILRNLLLGGAVAWSPRAETLLHFAARAEHIARTIEPALAAGMWVVCDRFADSTLAYQGYGQGAELDFIRAQAALLGLAPDLTLVLEVPPPVAAARLRDRGGIADRYEREAVDFHARVTAGFHAIASSEPARCRIVDAEGQAEAVCDRLLAVVTERFGL